MSDEAIDLFAMLAALRKAGRTTPEEWGELAALLNREEQPSLFGGE